MHYLTNSYYITISSKIVVRKSLPLNKNRLWSNLAAGRPGRVGPYACGRWPCFFTTDYLRGLRSSSSPVCDTVPRES